MPVSSPATAIILALIMGSAAATQLLAPTDDLNLPASETASDPLKWLGANSPWFAGKKQQLIET